MRTFQEEKKTNPNQNETKEKKLSSIKGIAKFQKILKLKINNTRVCLRNKLNIAHILTEFLQNH